MSRALPAGIARVGELLKTQAGYLRNVVREAGTTCTVCATPVDGFELCYQCNQHARSGIARADRVASIVYARIPPDQTYRVMRGYKGRPPIPAHTRVVASLLLVGYVGHLECVLGLAGTDDLVWATVPSLRRSAGEHPLHQLVEDITAGMGREVRLVPGANVGDQRALRPGNVAVAGAPPTGAHVLLIDDSWVSGGHAQSAAAALKIAGASSVSVLNVARVLREDWTESRRFIASRLSQASYSPEICPWTGTICP